MFTANDVPESFALRGGAKLHDDEVDPAWRDPDAAKWTTKPRPRARWTRGRGIELGLGDLQDQLFSADHTVLAVD